MSKSNKDRFRNPHKRSKHINHEQSSEDSENIFRQNGDDESDSDYTENIEYGMKKSKDQYPQLLPLSTLHQMNQPVMGQINPMNPVMALRIGQQPLPPGLMPMMAHNTPMMPLGNLKEDRNSGKKGKKMSRNELRALEKKVKALENEISMLKGDNELLESKCEEYLSQLQRSADIIESTKNKHKIQLEDSEDKIMELQDYLTSEKQKNETLEVEIEKVLNLNDQLNYRERKEQGELGSMIQDLRAKNMEIEKTLEDKDLALEDTREQLRLLTIQRDNIQEENEELKQQIFDNKAKSQVEEDKYYNLELDYKHLKEDYNDLREANIKLESKSHSLEDRIQDKDKELERMRAELGVLERMVSSMSSKNGREVPPPEEYYGRDSIDRSNRLSHKSLKRPSSRKRTRFREPVEQKHSANVSKAYGNRNQTDHFNHENLKEGKYVEDYPRQISSDVYYKRGQGDHFDHERLKNGRYPEDMPRQVDGNSYAKHNQEDHFSNGYKMRDHTHKTRFQNVQNKRHVGDSNLAKSKKDDKSGGNILTWDQPYDRRKDQSEMKYEAKEARRRKINQRHNSNFDQNQHRSQSRNRFERDKSAQNHERKVRKPSMHKLDHEMMKNEKVKIKLEKSLLRTQIERDNAGSQLIKLRRTKKKTGQILQRIRDLENEEITLEKEISKLKIEIRGLK